MRSRHWRQLWDPKAEMTFRKRMVIGDEVVMPGDVLTEEHRKLIGLHRLRFWWEGQFLQIKAKAAPVSPARAKQQNAIDLGLEPALSPEEVKARSERRSERAKATWAARRAAKAAEAAAAQTTGG